MLKIKQKNYSLRSNFFNNFGMFKFEEKILLQQVQRGQEAAFSRLYDSYQDKIYRFIYFRVSSESLAQDLTSETFMKVLQYLTSGKKIDSFQSFIYRTARNLVIDTYRQRGQEELPIDDFVRESIADQKDIAGDVADKFSLEQIEQGLGQLSGHYRDAIVLRFVEDLPFKDVGEVLGINEEHARVLVHRGLKMLKNTLQIKDFNESS